MPEFPCHATIDGEVDAAVEDEQDLGDTAGDHCPERHLEAVLLPSFHVILQGYELMNVEDDSQKVPHEEHEADGEKNVGLTRSFGLASV